MASVVDLRVRDAAAPGAESEPAVVPPRAAAGDLLELESAGAGRGYLPRRPWLARDARGRPVLSLTVVLARRPGPDESEAWSLIERGVLSFDATLAIPSSSTAAPVAAARPAFARSALFRLTSRAGQSEVARALTSGPGAGAALTASLDAADVRAVLDALAGAGSGMELLVDLVLDREPVRTSITLRALWAAVYDAIEREAAGGSDFDLAVLEHAVQQLVSSGGLELSAEPAGIAPADALAAAVRGLTRDGGIILARLPGPGPRRYRLTERPSEAFGWRYTETLSVPATAEVRIEAPLEQVLGGALDGRDWDEFVRLVAPDGPDGGYTTVPRRSRGDVMAVDRDAGGLPVTSMVLVGSTMVDASAVTATARPALRPAALASGEVRHLWLADGVLDYRGKGRVRSLPVTADGSETLFPDRLDPTRRWYVPALEIVEPNPAGDPDAAAFLFSFERIGTTGTGDAALSATVRVTLRPAVPDAVRAALAGLGNPPAQPVELLDLGVELAIPFIDSADNSPTRTVLRGTVERAGADIVATFAVAAQWVRLAYGVLSPSDFGPGERPAIRYAFRYESYRVTQGSWIRPLNGLKQALIPIDWNPNRAVTRPLAFDPAAAVLTAGATSIRFAREEVAAAVHEVAGRGLAGHVATAAILARPIERPGITPLPLEIRPALVDVIPPLREQVYVQQSVGVQGAADVLMPCDRFGPLYRQRLATGWQAIGCQEAFRLGTAPAQLYQEIGTLASEWFRVYRCLPQPGRFLVLPRAYRIARYAPGHERAYLPAAMVYAVLDPDTVADNRYRFVATVEPDIPPFAVRALRAALGLGYAPPASIQLDLPTDAATAVALPSMPVASALAQPRFTVAGTGVQVVLECQIADALVLRSAIEAGGVLGRLAFTMDDGSELGSDVEILLSGIVGPWGAGAVSAEVSGGQARLTNRIDRAVDVSALRLYAGVAAATEVAVGQRLEPQAAAPVPVDDEEAELAVVYTIPPGGPRSIEEARVYVEDVTTNVIFTCGIDYAARGIAEIEVSARLRGVGGEERVTMSDGMPRTGSADFVAPLSSIIGAGTASPVIEYRLVRVMTNGDRFDKGWAVCPGALVDIQWQQVA